MEPVHDEHPVSSVGTITELFNAIINETCLSKKVTILRALRTALEQFPRQANVEDVQWGTATMCAFARSLLFSGVPIDSREDEERQYEKGDFPGVSETACEGMVCARLFLSVASPEQVGVSDFLTPLQVLCFAHGDPKLPWCSEASVSAASALAAQLESPSSARQLISLLKYIQPKLTKETWKKNPCYRRVFKVALFQLRHPDMSDALPIVLPPALLLVDDYMTHNQILGLDCVHHITVNAAPSELDRHGYQEVLFDALKHLLYVKEPEVIVKLHTCIRNLLFSDYLDVLRTFRIKDEKRQRMAEDVYNELFAAAEMEQAFALRKAYSSQFCSYIECLGIDVVKYMDKTLRVLLEYVEVYDTEEQECRRNALLALAMLIKHTWLRIPSHFRTIVESLFKLTYDLDEHNRTVLWAEIVECLHLLRISCPDEYKTFKEDMSLLEGSDIPGIPKLRACVAKCEEKV
ncbi:TELO2-interacting protein 2-like [Haemaphysalis longicornis]